MIKLIRIDGKNIGEVLKLKTGEFCRSFAVSIEYCIIEAYIVQNAGGKAFPFALYKDDIPIGFCMIGYGREGYNEDGSHINAHDGYHIRYLVIDEGYRGKDYEKAALREILDYIYTQPCGPADFCYVSYRAEDREAGILFGSMGFVETTGKDMDPRTAVLELRYGRQDQPVNADSYLDRCVQKDSITRSSGIFDKIRLFMSLFRGREDVYAKRWVNLHTGKSGYSPACRNEWVPGICRKPCSKCPSASYYPYTIEAVQQHLDGGNDVVLGIYPLLQDDTCRFLALDLDEETWIQDAAAIREICKSNDIPCSVERSRSGNGAHIWFFFCDPVPAVSARKMGSSLITAAMRSDARLSFASYDRMFPNQDYMPKGGFGNLIALPLQPKAARGCGGSLFIDENGKVYPDQWVYLSSIQKMSNFDVEKAAAKIAAAPLGELAAEDEEDKPWNRTGKKQITEKDKTRLLHCVIADRIYISTKDVSEAVQDRLKRLAAFRNPEFYRKQSMRLPVWDTPRIICCADYEGSQLCLPRGLREEIDAFASLYHIETEWEDLQESGKRISVLFRGSLYPEQMTAFESMARYDKGVLSATTAFGKTVIGAALIAEKKTSTLILVHRKQLLDQWKERLEQFLEIHTVMPASAGKRGRKKRFSPIGTYGNGKNNRSGIIDIAMMQSLERKEDLPEWIGEYGLVIVDECHHVPAVSFETVLKKMKARFAYGLTATPRRKDGHHPIISMYLGPIRYKVDAKAQAANRPFAHLMIPRFTGMLFSAPAEAEPMNIGTYYTQITDDDIRNHMIIDDVMSCLEEGRNCLILSERVRHVQKLSELLRDRGQKPVVLVGGQTSSESNSQMQRLREAPQEVPVTVCATGKFIGEGFDESRLDTLFLTMPISWEGILAQYAGRLHRLYHGKDEVRVYDYVDDQAVMLERMYNKRLRTYAALGYQVCGERNDTYLNKDIIYDQRTFIEPFLHDIRSARQSVIIVSPFIKDSRVKWLFDAVHNDPHPVKVTVITRPLEAFHGISASYAERAFSSLKENHADIACMNAIHQKFAVIDRRTVWYGSINLLSFGSSRESMIRIVSGSVADTLLKAVSV